MKPNGDQPNPNPKAETKPETKPAAAPGAKSDAQKNLKSIPMEELQKKLGSSPDGLSEAEAKKRLTQYGPNEITEKKDNPFLKFLTYFWGPIPWMIEGAVILSGAVQHWLDFFIILLLLVSNAVVAFWEEHQAGNEIAALPATRKPGEAVFSGSIIKRGETEAMLYATGVNTYFGKTAQLVQVAHTVSHFQRAVLKIGNYLIGLAVVLVAVIISFALFRGDPILTTLEFALVLTVAAIPVAMPTVLSAGVARLDVPDFVPTGGVADPPEARV